MLSYRVHCTLVLFGLVFAFCCVSAVSHSDLRFRRFLQKAKAAGLNTQDSSKYALEDLISQLVQSDSEALENEMSVLDENSDAGLELERSADMGKVIPPRERKAGCRNYYWKTITSC
ncbi:SMS protein, partial [Atractosteus spatula]|nr:SMS protein [Atractosteus spatula]